MGQAKRRGSYEERIAQSLEKERAADELRAIEREKREQERMERVRANSLLQTNSGTGGRKGKSRILHTAAMLALMGGIGHI